MRVASLGVGTAQLHAVATVERVTGESEDLSQIALLVSEPILQKLMRMAARNRLETAMSSSSAMEMACERQKGSLDMMRSATGVFGRVSGDRDQNRTQTLLYIILILGDGDYEI